MITGTYNLIADPSWALTQLQEVRLECDTTLGPVTINLPAISTLAKSTNLKLFIVDVTANANVNNITINAGATGLPPLSDTFDDSTTTSLVLNTDGSSVVFQNVAATQWIATESVSSGGGVPTYKVYSANIEMATGAINNLFENTLGVTLTWIPASGEINTGIVIGLIGQNNVFVQVSSCTTTSSPKIVSGQFTPSPWIVTIKQTDDAGVLDSTQSVYVEIRVYN